VAAVGEAMPPKSTFSYGDDSPRRTFTAAGERFEAPSRRQTRVNFVSVAAVRVNRCIR
jgi:hypothetical protein